MVSCLHVPAPLWLRAQSHSCATPRGSATPARAAAQWVTPCIPLPRAPRRGSLHSRGRWGGLTAAPGASSLDGAAPEGFVEASVATVQLSKETGPVIYLRVTTGDSLRGLLLPVFVGETEGHALASHLRKQPTSRPMTHDLMKNALAQMSVQVVRVQVTHLQSNTYFARIVMSNTDKAGAVTETDVDARPSDAINLAVRCGAPIFVSADLARTHGVRASVPEGPSSDASPAAGSAAPAAEALPAAPVRLLDKTLELRIRLAVAIQEGRHRDAQTLRDDIAVLLAGDSSTVRATAAAQLILEIECAIKDERWKDAAQARNHLAELNHVVRPNFMLNFSDNRGPEDTRSDAA